MRARYQRGYFGLVIGRLNLLVGSSFGGITNQQDGVFAVRRLSEPSNSIQIWKTRGKPATAYAYRSMKPEIVS